MLSSVGFAQDGHEHHEGDGHNHSAVNAAESTAPPFEMISEEHSDELSSLLVQHKGRIIPMHTLCDQLLRKISRNNTFEDKDAVQTIMSMHMYPEHWIGKEVIYVSGKSNLREKLGMESSYISFKDLADSITGDFVLRKEYDEAHRKREAERGEFDKRLIQLVERFNVVRSVLSWSFMKILPLKDEPNNTWFMPMSSELLQSDSVSTGLAFSYFRSLDNAAKKNNYDKSNELLDALKLYQREVGKSVVPSESKIQMEISYNKMNIFKNSYRSYLLFGVVLLIIFFIKIFVQPTTRSKKVFRIVSGIMLGLTIIIFAYHGYGLYMRAVISGHVPWAKGYEVVVFIAWVTVLIGLILSKKNAVILAGCLILASLMIFVSEMNIMDPEITPLVPVLKSYWLQIHVAVITGSYAPLAISCILGLLNLILYIFRTKKNGTIVTMNINELTYVAEMTMTIGVFMLAIGTFLGGIWANESWGRYWGWDPKETWALVAVLTYAVILHLRYIPSLKSKFTFNVASFWGYTTILFTFFGVNFYLVGLHSYAQGDGLGEFPTGIIVAAIIFAIFTVIASFRNKKYLSNQKQEVLE
jgi:cytochrome c-type biogenesis protein CcsB